MNITASNINVSETNHLISFINHRCISELSVRTLGLSEIKIKESLYRPLTLVHSNTQKK